MGEALRDAILDWYIFLSSLSAPVTTGVLSLEQRIGIPLISALLLGVIGAAAPCQLSQSLGMLAVLGAEQTGQSRWRATLAYVAGKGLVYSALGIFVVVAGASFSQLSIPVFVAARKALGPLMIIVGLGLAGALRFPWAPGYGLALRLRQALRRRAAGAPFLFGVAFGFSFCPTLFGLFFGFLIPLALSQPDGLLYPALFALGTALPLLGILGLLALGGESLRHYARQVGRGQRIAAVLAGTLLIATGLHDTAVYWLL